MTSAQTRYWELQEAIRHNKEQEANWAGQLVETTRSNKAREELTRYSTDVQADTSRYVADSNLAASRYAADRHYDAAIYSADTAAAASRYVSDQNARVQQQVAAINAASSRYASDSQRWSAVYTSDQSAATQRYSTDVNAEVNRERTTVEHEDRQALLAFNRQNQQVLNALQAKKVRLEALRTAVQNSNTSAATKKILTEVRSITENLEMNARRLKLDETAAQYNNKLTEMRTMESQFHQAQMGFDAISKVFGIVTSIIALSASTGG